MKAFILTALMVSVLALPGHLSAFSAGSNMFASSPTITGSEGVSNPTNLTPFNDEDGEPTHPDVSAIRRTAWWRWTAPSTGFCTVDTRMSVSDLHGISDTLVGVYTGNVVNGLSRVAAVDDYNSLALFPDSYHASAVFYAQAGVTYHIVVDGYAGTILTERYNVILRLRHVALQRSIHGASWRMLRTDSVNHTGAIQVTTTGTGALTGRFRIGTRSFPFAGAFGTDGLFTASFLLPPTPGFQPEPPITLVFSGAGFWPFQITSGSLGRSMGNLFERKVFSTSVPSPFAGRFTAGLFTPSSIGGYGFVSMKVANSGLGQGVMVLPDGAAVTFSSYPFSSGSMDYYYDGHLPRNNGKGVFNYSLTIRESGAHDDVWGYGFILRPPAPSAVFFPGGYREDFSFTGGTWTKPVLDSRALGFLSDVSGLGKLSVFASGGEISSTIEENLSFGTDNRFVFTSGARRPSLVLNLNTGVLTGSINEPSTRKRSIRGVLFRNVMFNTTIGAGLVTGTTRTQAFGVTKR